MLLPLALSALGVAAVLDRCDDDNDEAMARFRLLMGMGDREGAYQVLFDSMDPAEEHRAWHRFYREMMNFTRQSHDLDTLLARLTEFEAIGQVTERSGKGTAWQNVKSTDILFYLVFNPEPGKVPPENSCPWFFPFAKNVEATNRSGTKTHIDVKVKLPRWKQAYDIELFTVEGIPESEQPNLWSADRTRALVSTSKGVSNQGDFLGRSFQIVPLSRIRLLRIRLRK